MNKAAIEFCNGLLREERWLKASAPFSGKCLLVRAGGEELLPAFQFRGGLLHPRLDELLRLLPAGGDGWAAAIWCFQPTLKLGGARPADVFWSDAESVIDAARRDFVGDDADW